VSIDLEYEAPKTRRWDGMAIASMSLSMSSPFVAVFGLLFLHTPLILAFWIGPALLAAVLGIRSVIQINKSGGQLRGIYLASAGIVMALAWGVFVLWVLGNVMFD